MKKKIICTLALVLVVTVSLALNANALSEKTPRVATEGSYGDYQPVPEGTVYDDLSKEPEEFDYSNVGVATETEFPEFDESPTNVQLLEDSSRLRGDSKPDQKYDLSKSNYYFNLPDYITSSYTNYYFYPNSNGDIRVQIDKIDSNNKTFKIVCYKISGGSAVSTWEGKPSDGTNALFYNLNSSTGYYFQFKSVGLFNNLCGDGKIYH